ncbi:MAG: hypothetical protein KA149_01760 [Chitinophagales bacterium]|nr:hypothetical protein [Chitinophagales bacterium]
MSLNYSIKDWEIDKPANFNSAYWSEATNTIFVARKDDEAITIEGYHEDTSLHTHSVLLDYKLSSKILDLKYFAEENLFCICSGSSVALFDKEGHTVLEYQREEGILSAQYGSAGVIYLELYEYSGNRSLGVWNTKSNTVSRYELESWNHYNRAFKINSTSEILFGTCNAYECGLNIHVLNFENEKLRYINQPGLFCHRDEIECYALSINSFGDEYAMIVDYYNGRDAPLLCYYSIYSQGQAIKEITLPEQRGTDVNYNATYFLYDKYILLESKNSLTIIDPRTSHGEHKFEHIEKDENSFLAVNNLRGKFVFKQKNRLRICELHEIVLIDEKRITTMQEFLKDIQAGKYSTVQVEE